MKQEFSKRVVSIAGIDPIKLLGIGDRTVRLLEEHFDERIVVRGDEITISGSPRRVEQLTRAIEHLVEIAGGGRSVTDADVLAVIRGGRPEVEQI